MIDCCLIDYCELLNEEQTAFHTNAPACFIKADVSYSLL